jgi:large conductance mechanosensitive channel
MLKEFKEFALKGNVVDLAIGVIIGGAFGKIVDSMVGDVIMPIIGAVTGGLDFSNKFFLFKALTGDVAQPATYAKAKEVGATFGYGQFLTVTLNFLIVAFVLFLVVKLMNRLKKQEAAAAAPAPAPDRTEVLLTEIRDLLKK